MQDIIKSLPDSPGVYQYFNQSGKLLYVGKAKNLKNRVKSYWRFSPNLHPNPNQSHRITKMLSETTSLEYIVVDNEADALILENSLIKQLKPKYNILLRDDKTYPYIYIDESLEYPRFEITRKVVKGKNIKYFGPFPTAGKALIDAIYEIYPLIQKKACLKEGKACLFYQIKKCLAPCEGLVTSNEYRKIITTAKEALLNRKVITEQLETKMVELALNERFEEAAKLRDSIESISNITLESNIDLASNLNLDIISILNGDDRGVVIKMFMRDGKIVSSSHNYFRHTHLFDEDEAYRQAILEFYNQSSPNIAKEIIVAHDIKDIESIEETTFLKIGQKVKITYPKIGVKKRLSTLATTNANELLRVKKDTLIEQQIADLFNLSSIPYRTEIFDNSHMMGVANVGGMVVWHENSWDKNNYRRYSLTHTTEYEQMRELLSRRIEEFKNTPPPDLWILDGGKANLNLAIELLANENVNLDVIAISKEKLDSKAYRAKGAAKDLIYTTNELFELKSNDKRLQWIQHKRDEAHRYAITYHQNKKRKDDTQVSLLNKKGIGKATVQKLINYFGTFEAIDKASIEELQKVTNKKIASIIKHN